MSRPRSRKRMRSGPSKQCRSRARCPACIISSITSQSESLRWPARSSGTAPRRCRRRARFYAARGPRTPTEAACKLDGLQSLFAVAFQAQGFRTCSSSLKAWCTGTTWSSSQVPGCISAPHKLQREFCSSRIAFLFSASGCLRSVACWSLLSSSTTLDSAQGTLPIYQNIPSHLLCPCRSL